MLSPLWYNSKHLSVQLIRVPGPGSVLVTVPDPWFFDTIATFSLFGPRKRALTFLLFFYIYLTGWVIASKGLWAPAHETIRICRLCSKGDVATFIIQGLALAIKTVNGAIDRAIITYNHSVSFVNLTPDSFEPILFRSVIGWITIKSSTNREVFCRCKVAHSFVLPLHGPSIHEQTGNRTWHLPSM